jgi:capsule polysaccharide export protein KpsE/RkpR
MEQPQGASVGSESWTQANGVESVHSTATSGDAPSGIIHMLRLFWVKRQMMSGILATGILLSILYAYYLPVVYTSTTTLMPPDSASSNSNLMSLLSATGSAGTVGTAALGMKTPGAVFTGILGSRTVQEDLVRRFNLMSHYKQHLLEDACKQLMADTVIREDTKSGIIAISVIADSPLLASNIAQGYVAELDRVVNNNSTSAARRERIFLEERLKEIKQDLDDSAKALSQFSTKSRTIDIPSQGKAMVDSGLRLQDQMVAARSDLAGLQQSYSEDNVRVRSAHARIAELQLQIDKIMGSTKEPTLDVNDSAYPSISELPALGLTYSDLQRKMSVEEALWEALTRQYEAARVQEAKEIPTVRVLDVANIPQHKSAPARASIVMLGGMLSLFAACILVFVISFWEKMGTLDEPKKLLTEIVGTTLNSLQWFWCLPGICWLHTRLRGSEQHR